MLKIGIFIGFVLIHSEIAQSAVVSWSPAERATGYKLYWEIIDECDSSSIEAVEANMKADMRYSINVFNTTSYDLKDDKNFTEGNTYVFRVTSYNKIGLESKQSENLTCFTYKGPIAPSNIENDGASTTKKK